jgi:hypothetical protein
MTDVFELDEVEEFAELLFKSSTAEDKFTEDCSPSE